MFQRGWQIYGEQLYDKALHTYVFSFGTADLSLSRYASKASHKELYWLDADKEEKTRRMRERKQKEKKCVEGESGKSKKKKKDRHKGMKKYEEKKKKNVVGRKKHLKYSPDKGTKN